MKEDAQFFTCNLAYVTSLSLVMSKYFVMFHPDSERDVHVLYYHAAS